jgi:hypothetical protein
MLTCAIRAVKKTRPGRRTPKFPVRLADKTVPWNLEQCGHSRVDVQVKA